MRVIGVGVGGTGVGVGAGVWVEVGGRAVSGGEAVAVGVEVEVQAAPRRAIRTSTAVRSRTVESTVSFRECYLIVALQMTNCKPQLDRTYEPVRGQVADLSGLNRSGYRFIPTEVGIFLIRL